MLFDQNNCYFLSFIQFESCNVAVDLCGLSSLELLSFVGEIVPSEVS